MLRAETGESSWSLSCLFLSSLHLSANPISAALHPHSKSYTSCYSTVAPHKTSIFCPQYLPFSHSRSNGLKILPPKVTTVFTRGGNITSGFIPIYIVCILIFLAIIWHKILEYTTILAFLFVWFGFVFEDRVSQCNSPGCSGTCFVQDTDLEFRDPPASASHWD